MFSWTIAVHAGGLPPYIADVMIWQALGPTATDSNNTTGNITLTTPGYYEVLFSVKDSTCTQYGWASTQVFAWGTLGPHPVNVTASTLTGPAPLAESYHAALASPLPPNWTLAWGGELAPFTANGTFDNYTYVDPGTYWGAVVLIEPGGGYYGYFPAPNVTVSGVGPFTTAVTATPGPYPIDVTFWVNRTNASLAWLPANETKLFLSSYGGTRETINITSNLTATVTDTGVGCGVGYGYFGPDPSGNCTLYAIVEVVGTAVNMLDNGSFGTVAVFWNLTAPGPVSNWVPTLSLAVGPLSGPGPLNVSLNLTVTNGTPPYRYDYLVAGHSPGANGSFLPPISGTISAGSGSTKQLIFDLNRTGYYFLVVLVLDSRYEVRTYSPPLILVGTNVTVAAPLHIQADESVGPNPRGNASIASFSAEPTGGVGPFTVQWAFGDGTFASSVPGVVLHHLYDAPGTYDPTVTITSADGQSVTTHLPPVTVGPSSGLPRGNSSGASGGSTNSWGGLPFLGVGRWEFAWWPAGAVVLGVLAWAALAVVLSRRELRRQGERLVEPWGGSVDGASGAVSPDR
ncbi:MAG TPA: PKD domain-containing protein [Thermoplasmata archaeon]|nr:PKD domain-containing protein [Thermoplasmata archaeon]